MRLVLIAGLLPATSASAQTPEAFFKGRQITFLIGAGAGGGYDGLWNVLIITQAGSCDPAYSYPFRVSGGRISTAGAADVSGSVGPGGVVAVRISAGGRVASGNGRRSGSTGSGRWTARVSSGNCSGRWQATRG